MAVFYLFSDTKAIPQETEWCIKCGALKSETLFNLSNNGEKCSEHNNKNFLILFFCGSISLKKIKGLEQQEGQIFSKWNWEKYKKWIWLVRSQIVMSNQNACNYIAKDKSWNYINICA